MMTSHTTKLLTQHGCVQSLILRFAAEVKGVEHMVLPVEDHSDFVRLLGVTQLPALSDHNVTTGDLDIVLEYLEEQHPAPALLPANVASRVVYRKQVRSFHRDLFPLLSQAKSGDAQARSQLGSYLQQMNDVAKDHRFFASDSISVMDVTLAPWLWTAKEQGLCLKQYKHLSCYADRMFAIRAFQRCLQEPLAVEKAA